MNFNSGYTIGAETQLLAPSQKSVLSDDINWTTDLWKDVSVITDNAGAYTSGTLAYDVEMLNSLGVVVSYTGTVTYNTTKDQTLTDLATALQAKAAIKTCTYVGSSTHTITTTAEPGYRITSISLTGAIGGVTFSEVLSGGIWWCKHKGVRETCKGIITTSATSVLCVLPRLGRDSNNLHEWRLMPVTTYSINDYYLFDAILKTFTTAAVYAAAASQFLF